MFTRCANCKKLLLRPFINGLRLSASIVDGKVNIHYNTRFICSECKRNGWAK